MNWCEETLVAFIRLIPLIEHHQSDCLSEFGSNYTLQTTTCRKPFNSGPRKMSNSILSAIADLQRHNFEVQVVDIHRIIVTLHGPSNSVYRNGVWKVGIKLPENFPNNPPLLVRFLNQIFHPNIEWETGNVCLDVLSQCWNRESNLYQIFEHYLPELLCKPFPIDPFNVRAANMYLQNLEEFEAVAIEHKNNFALEHHIRDLDFGDFDDYSLPVNPA